MYNLYNYTPNKKIYPQLVSEIHIMFFVQIYVLKNFKIKLLEKEAVDRMLVKYPKHRQLVCVSFTKSFNLYDTFFLKHET